MPPSAGKVQIIDISSGPFDKETCSHPKPDFLRNLAERGIRTVIRYYSDQDNLPCKNISREERSLLHDFGFSVAIVYQFNGRAPGRYTKETGKKDARFCLTRAEEIGQPDGSAIYFGIDADTATHDPAGVIDYLVEVNRIFGGRFLIGCYGAGTICKKALDEELVALTWVPEAPAWSGTRDFMNSGRWTFYQNKTDMTLSKLSKGHGIEIDTDIVNPKFNTIGAFARDNSIVSYDASDVRAIADARKWVNQLKMPLFDSPGGSQIGHMCIARMVTVLSPLSAGWVSIDIDEDGDPNGCCESRFLSPLAIMPRWMPGCAPMPL